MTGAILFFCIGMAFILLGIYFIRRKKEIQLPGIGSLGADESGPYNLEAVGKLVRAAVIVLGGLLVLLGVLLFVFPRYSLVSGICIFTLMLAGLFVLVGLMNSRLCRNTGSGGKASGTNSEME
jgi:uncharacterized membrane protein HdeD (DUF308 family)